jgi:von Willebrand factor A domain-containing protein 7
MVRIDPLRGALGIVASLLLSPAVSAQRAYSPGVCGPLDPVYVRTAAETGGQPFPMAPSEIAKSAVGVVMSESSRGDATMILWASGTLTDTDGGFAVPIDGSVTRVTFSITFDGTGGRVEIARPDGVVIQPGSTAGDTILNCGRIFSIDAPVAGTWRMKPAPTNRFWAVVHARSAVDLMSAEFVRRGGRPGHEGLFPIHGMPLAGRTATLRVELSEPQTRTPEFLLISGQGKAIERIALQRVSAEEFVGEIALPTVPFRVAVAGSDDSGAPYLRVHPGLFRAESVEVAPVSLDGVDITAAIDTPLTFIVRNHGQRARYRVVATVGAEVMKRVEPPIVELAANSETRVNVWLPATIAVAGKTIELLVVASTDDSASPSMNSALQRVTFVK